MEMCRACMLLDYNLIPLDEQFICNYNLLTNLNVKLQDKMPQYCCQNCADTVKHFIQFRDKSITSETTLQEFVKVQEIKVKYEFTMEICNEQNNTENELDIKTETTDTFSDSATVFNEASEFSDSGIQEINVTRKSTRNKKQNIKIETGANINKIKVKKKCIKNRKQNIKTDTCAESIKPKKIVPKRQKRKKKQEKSGQVKEECENKSLLCGICTKKFEVLDDLRSHLETHKMNKQCGICDEDTISWPQLLGHRVKHLSAQQKRCHLCNKKHNTPAYMEYHYLIAHNDDGQEKILTCNKCCRTYQAPRNLQSHLWSVHSEAKYFCDYCSKGFHSKCSLRRHIIKHLNYSTFSCKLCEYTCRSYAALQRHKICKHCPSKAQCKTCYRFFENQEKCDKHKCFDNTIVVCPVCGLQFPRSKRLSKHLRSHRENYKCSICPALFKTSGALKAHVDRHNGTRTRKCEYCDAKFYTYSSLTKHRRRHTGEKPYVCKICNKGFTGNNNLKMHMRVHGLFLIKKKEVTSQ